VATNLSNALKEYLEGLGLGIAAYKDAAPDDEKRPFATITEGISVTPDGFGDGGVGETGTEMVQVDVWEDWRDEDDNVVESSSLALAVARATHGAKLAMAPGRVYGVSVVSRRRLLEPDTNTVHTAITANVRREL
jgi:hypothetical protein